MAIALIGLGSNLGERKHHLESAIEQIRQLSQTEVLAVSRWHETEPVGGPPQGKFLNGAAKIETALSPESLAKELQQIERSLGRPPERIRWGPRVIDLDLLGYEDRVIQGDRLTVPHPRLQERPFVLLPLAEVAPEWRHPLLQKNAREMLADLPA